MTEEKQTAEQELAEMKKACKNLDIMLSMILESSKPKTDMVSESKYYCAQAFLEPVIEKIKKFI